MYLKVKRMNILTYFRSLKYAKVIKITLYCGIIKDGPTKAANETCLIELCIYIPRQ